MFNFSSRNFKFFSHPEKQAKVSCSQSDKETSKLSTAFRKYKKWGKDEKIFSIYWHESAKIFQQETFQGFLEKHLKNCRESCEARMSSHNWRMMREWKSNFSPPSTLVINFFIFVSAQEISLRESFNYHCPSPFHSLVALNCQAKNHNWARNFRTSLSLPNWWSMQQQIQTSKKLIRHSIKKFLSLLSNVEHKREQGNFD